GGSPARPVVATKLDPEAMQAFIQDLQQRADLINRLADKHQSDAAAQFGPGFNVLDWRRDFGARMIYQSVESLAGALAAPNLSVVQNELFSAKKRILKHAFNTDLRRN